MAQPASIGARVPAATLIAAVFGAAALAGCTGTSKPAPAPTSVSSTATSSRTSTSTPAPTTPATSAQPARISTLPRYDVSTLIGSNIYDFPVGRPGPHGGVLLQQTAGTTPISVAGATGPVSMYLPCCTDSAHLVLDYQVGSTRPANLTQTPIADNQGIVLDGRLIAIVAILPVGTQPRVQAQVIVFPASAASGLPVVK